MHPIHTTIYHCLLYYYYYLYLETGYRCPKQYGFQEIRRICYAVIDWDTLMKKDYNAAEQFCSFFRFELLYLEDETQREDVVLLMRKAKPNAQMFWIQGSFNNSK